MEKKQSRIKTTTCYMCDNVASSREHVPPVCFFPEAKDLPPGVDYRKNLIRVPSCDDHNLAKSKDDEYLWLVILSLGGNLAAQRLFSTKAMRAIKDRQSLLGLITKNATPTNYLGQKTISFEVDRARFEKSLIYLVRALYFNHSHRKWNYDILIEIPSFIIKGRYDPLKTNLMKKELDKIALNLLDNREIYGDNHEIFYYQIYHNPEMMQLCVRIVFYEKTTILATSWPLYFKYS